MNTQHTLKTVTERDRQNTNTDCFYAMRKSFKNPLFDFHLDHIEDCCFIKKGDRSKISWFDLTCGYYRIVVGDNLKPLKKWAYKFPCEEDVAKIIKQLERDQKIR